MDTSLFPCIIGALNYYYGKIVPKMKHLTYKKKGQGEKKISVCEDFKGLRYAS